MLKVQQNYKVGIYVRLSKDDERAGKSVSIENQKLMLTKYCEEQGWNEYSIYCDDGASGTNFDRPGVDTLHSDNNIMPFRNLLNEFQSKDTSKKIKAVKQTHAKLGNYLGTHIPYGYRAHPEDKHKFVVDEYSAGIVKRMFAYRRQSYGFRKIAGILNQEKILPPRDYNYQQKGIPNHYHTNHCWNDVTVKKMLRNEVYLGHMVQNKRGTLSYKNKKQIDKPKDE